MSEAESASVPPPASQPAPAEPAARLWLSFGDQGTAAGAVGRSTHAAQDLSALALFGDTLWTAGDERASIERFVSQGNRDGGGFGEHRSYALGELLDLPAGPEGEVDIEGVDVDGGCLWVAGSHSLRRLKPDPEREAEPGALVERLARLDRQDNRYTLARLPLAPDERGRPAPVARTDARPTRKAAHLPFKGSGNRLTKLLRHDPHLAPFMTVPAKENGFDIEGLAVRGQRVFLGLRGPVLRGYAVILELRVEQKGRKLKLEPLGGGGGDKDGGERYRKHFLDLRGLGVRDLAFDGDDLLILAGPTLAHDGRHAVFRWEGALRTDAPVLLRDPEPRHLFDLRLVPDRDRAEGIALREEPGGRRGLIVVYDSPAAGRLDPGGGRVALDLFPLPDHRLVGPGGAIAAAASAGASVGSAVRAAVTDARPAGARRRAPPKPAGS